MEERNRTFISIRSLGLYLLGVVFLSDLDIAELRLDQ